VRKLQDQRLLADIAHADRDASVREAARETLARIVGLPAEVDALLTVLETGTDSARLQAGYRLTDVMREAAPHVSSDVLQRIERLDLSLRIVHFETVQEKGVVVWVDTGHDDDHHRYYEGKTYEKEIVTYETFSSLKARAKDELKRRKESEGP